MSFYGVRLLACLVDQLCSAVSGNYECDKNHTATWVTELAVLQSKHENQARWHEEGEENKNEN